MNSDRELLELAAKAAGIEYERDSKSEMGLILRSENGVRFLWNPLKDDAQALRLIARLRLRLDYRDGFVGVWKVGPYLGQCPHDEEDPYDTTATRRAIVRAAAELGRAMP